MIQITDLRPGGNPHTDTQALPLVSRDPWTKLLPHISWAPLYPKHTSVSALSAPLSLCLFLSLLLGEASVLVLCRYTADRGMPEVCPNTQVLIMRPGCSHRHTTVTHKCASRRLASTWLKGGDANPGQAETSQKVSTGLATAGVVLAPMGRGVVGTLAKEGGAPQVRYCGKSLTPGIPEI